MYDTSDVAIPLYSIMWSPTVLQLFLFPFFFLFFSSFNLETVVCTQVWSVLKPGFLAFLDDPFNNKPLDIMIFDILPYSNGDGGTKNHYIQ